MLKGCILSKFYIKPQQRSGVHIDTVVVSYRNSTSNHNFVGSVLIFVVVVSYRNSTSNHNTRSRIPTGPNVVSYRNSTSNHNETSTQENVNWLYLIEILHQTTTSMPCCIIAERCILSKFYIKPQPFFARFVSFRVVSYRNSTSNHNQCSVRMAHISVVSYRNSTSNHNETS